MHAPEERLWTPQPIILAPSDVYSVESADVKYLATVVRYMLPTCNTRRADARYAAPISHAPARLDSYVGAWNPWVVDSRQSRPQVELPLQVSRATTATKEGSGSFALLFSTPVDDYGRIIHSQ